MEQESPILYEKLIYENEPKAYQLKLVVNEFRGTQYVHIRKYFLAYDGEYVPSREGVSMEASMHNILSLLDGMVELCSLEESSQTIQKYFSDLSCKLSQNTLTKQAKPTTQEIPF